MSGNFIETFPYKIAYKERTISERLIKKSIKTFVDIWILNRAIGKVTGMFSQKLEAKYRSTVNSLYGGSTSIEYDSKIAQKANDPIPMPRNLKEYRNLCIQKISDFAMSDEFLNKSFVLYREEIIQMMYEYADDNIVVTFEQVVKQNLNNTVNDYLLAKCIDIKNEIFFGMSSYGEFISDMKKLLKYVFKVFNGEKLGTDYVIISEEEEEQEEETIESEEG